MQKNILITGGNKGIGLALRLISITGRFQDETKNLSNRRICHQTL